MNKTKTQESKTHKTIASHGKIVPKAYTGPRKGESIFSFRNFYIEYARFHRDETNIWIHIVFIPIIVATMFGMGSYISWGAQTQIDYSAGNLSIKCGMFDSPKENEERIVFWTHYWVWGTLGAVYISCEPLVGLFTYVFGMMVLQFMLALRQLDESEQLLGGKFYQICGLVQIFGWATQFVGHGLCEQRAPAITTNLLFMFIAPFFDMFEVMNKSVGYKQAEIDEYLKIVDADIAHYRLSKGYKVDENLVEITQEFKKTK